MDRSLFLLDLPLRDIVSYCLTSSEHLKLLLLTEFWRVKANQEFGVAYGIDQYPVRQYLRLKSKCENEPEEFVPELIKQKRTSLACQLIKRATFFWYWRDFVPTEKKALAKVIDAIFNADDRVAFTALLGRLVIVFTANNSKGIQLRGLDGKTSINEYPVILTMVRRALQRNWTFPLSIVYDNGFLPMSYLFQKYGEALVDRNIEVITFLGSLLDADGRMCEMYEEMCEEMYE